MSWTRIDRIARYLVTDSTLYVACAGSDGWRDWWRNVDPRCETVFPGGWVSRADLREAQRVWAVLHRYARGRRVHVIGFSRGGGVAVALALWIPPHITVTAELYAPKRAATRRALEELPFVKGYATGGDIVPYLPPWFGQVPIERTGRDWPWRAHRAAARMAARRRHEIGRVRAPA
jgi:poly(3-hydroxybutyrate) depolymerase